MGGYHLFELRPKGKKRRKPSETSENQERVSTRGIVLSLEGYREGKKNKRKPTNTPQKRKHRNKKPHTTKEREKEKREKSEELQLGLRR